jgi:Holliday junction resolvase
MTEQQIQSKVIKKLENNGWYVIKLIRTTKVGIPDLMAIKDGVVKFFEVKRPKVGIVSEIQKYRIKQLNEHGIEAMIITSEQEI